MNLRNPFDRTQLYEFDLPAEGEEEEAARERELGPDQRSEALKQNITGKALTESAAFAILANYIDAQKQARINHLLLVAITDKNKDDLNFMRGELAGLMLAHKLAKLVADGAEATIELFNEAKKHVDDPSSAPVQHN